MLIRTDKDLINMDNVERIIIDVNIKGTSATVEANYNDDYATIATFESAETINCTDCANELIDMIMDAYERGARVLDLRTVKMWGKNMNQYTEEERFFKTQFTPKEQARMAGDALCYVLQKFSDEERRKRMSRNLEKLSIIGPLNSAAAELETALDRMKGRVLDSDELTARSEIRGALNQIRNASSILMEEFFEQGGEQV